MLKAKMKAEGKKLGPRVDQTRKYGLLHELPAHHLQRYLFAASKIPKGSRVLDVACGCGYGSFILQGAGFEVTGVDISDEAISYAESHYQGPKYLCKDAYELEGSWDAIVSLETLEHLVKPLDLLKAVKAPLLIASVPNENAYPFDPGLFKDDVYPHQRHYTPEQFSELLNEAGYEVVEKCSQKTKWEFEVVPDTRGMFLIYVANG